ncbi:MAG: hydrogenase expression/formation protein HypE [Proteobacteria bacterium]|nr:hydrogenase expression/formation protein HypE [Pseudomonadota bacterium]
MAEHSEKPDRVLLAHGSGGKLSQDLFQQVFQPRFGNPLLDEVHDGAVFEVSGTRFAFSTDSYVVNPLFFPGGNIGDLAVNGTVNDIAMCGARPLYLSAGFILEEGFSMDELDKIVRTMQKATEKAGVLLVTGDTKVVENGAADGVFINTAGVGLIEKPVSISPRNAIEGDAVILNGRIAEHGIAVMAKREGLDFETDILSDSAPLNGLVEVILEASDRIRVLRDPTRGGIAATLNEIAEAAGVGIVLDEERIPISEQVKAVSSILGLDPLYIANEGKLLAIVGEDDSQAVLSAMREHPEGRESMIIGRVVSEYRGKVVMETTIGTKRVVDMPSGEQLPRIC